MMLLEPNSILWLNHFLPAWSQVPIALSNPLQTLDEIKAELEAQQLSLGVEMPVGDEVVIPVWQTLSDCTETDCQAITSLRVYFVEEQITGDRRYSLLSEIRLGAASLDRFTALNFLVRGNEAGDWLSLEGQTEAADLTAANRYGILFFYDPVEKQLQNTLTWQNPAGRSPEWRQVLGDQDLELVIDQSQGIDPEFAVYQVKEKSKSPVLKPITLDKSALDLPIYQKALELARLKLWAIAAQQLQQVKQTIQPGTWTPEAETQLQFIHYHGQRLTEQCNALTLNIGQTISHCLQGGDVNEALRLLQNNIDDPLVVKTVVSFLEANGKGLQARLDVLHAMDPLREAVILWQFFALTAQDGSQKAIATLKQKQQIDGKLQTKINTLLGQIEKTLSQQAHPLSAESKVIGQLRPAGTIRPGEWLQPESQAIALKPDDNWHILEVSRFFDGTQWQQAPFKLDLSKFAPGQALWQTLGLNQNEQIYVGSSDFQQSASTAFGQVQAARLQNNKLQLLVRGQQSLPGGQAIAFSQKTLRWLTLDTMSIEELTQLDPAWVDEILENLWLHLRGNDLRFEATAPDQGTLLAEFGAWQIQPIELTGNNYPEARLTLYLNGKRKLVAPNPMGQTDPQLKPVQLIFADTGELIYSELTQAQPDNLKAIADLQDGGVAALVLQDKNQQISFKRWNPTQGAFTPL
jgi:hypothetical protein